MKYQESITLDTNITMANAVTQSLVLPKGILRETTIYFPWGCAGLTHIRIYHNEHVIYPTTPDEWFSGNDILIKFECMYKLTEAWNRFKIEGYNEDDFYSHTPIIAFVVLPVDNEPFSDIPWIEG